MASLHLNLSRSQTFFFFFFGCLRSRLFAHNLYLAWIQNVADPRQNGDTGKVFELTQPRFRRDMERAFRSTEIFPYRDQNCNYDRNRILNPCCLARLIQIANSIFQIPNEMR